MSASRFHDSPEERGRIVVLRRTNVAFETPAEVIAEASRVAAQLDAMGRVGCCLLMDLRQVSPNSSDRLEAAMTELRERIRRDFDRVAVLVKTKIGLLQANRIRIGDQDLNSRVFDDEDEAFAFLTSHE